MPAQMRGEPVALDSWILQGGSAHTRGRAHLATLSIGFSPLLDKVADEAQAKDFLVEYNSTAEVVWNAYSEASWAYNTNITDYNKQVMV